MDLLCCAKRVPAIRGPPRNLVRASLRCRFEEDDGEDGEPGVLVVHILSVDVDRRETPGGLFGYLDLFATADWQERSGRTFCIGRTPTAWMSTGGATWHFECPPQEYAAPKQAGGLGGEAVVFAVMAERLAGLGTPSVVGAAAAAVSELLCGQTRDLQLVLDDRRVGTLTVQAVFEPPGGCGPAAAAIAPLRLAGAEAAPASPSRARQPTVAAAGRRSLAPVRKSVAVPAALLAGLGGGQGGNGGGEPSSSSDSDDMSDSSDEERNATPMQKLLSAFTPAAKRATMANMGSSGSNSLTVRPRAAQPAMARVRSPSEDSSGSDRGIPPGQQFGAAMMRHWSGTPTAQSSKDLANKVWDAKMDKKDCRSGANSNALSEASTAEPPSGAQPMPGQSGRAPPHVGCRGKSPSMLAAGSLAVNKQELADRLCVTAKKYPRPGAFNFMSSPKDRFFVIVDPGDMSPQQSLSSRNWDEVELAWFTDEQAWRGKDSPTGSIPVAQVIGAIVDSSDEYEKDRSVTITYTDENSDSIELVLAFPSPAQARSWCKDFNDLTKVVRAFHKSARRAAHG